MKRILLLILLPLLAAASFAAPVDDSVVRALRTASQPLSRDDGLDPLVSLAGRARLVLLGESSHGTREFYRLRAALTKRLVAQEGFSFITIEGDWWSLLPLDRYVRHHAGAPASAREALLQIERWPRWLWANDELAELGEWLRSYNAGRPVGARVGIHGVDLYAIWESLDAVQAFYDRNLPRLAPWVSRLYAPLAGFQGDYRGYAAHFRETRESAAPGPAWIAQDLAMRYRMAPAAYRERLFEVLQHARVVESGEGYLARAEPHAWNTRAAHFGQTVDRLLQHYGPAGRGIVWAHNTHIGDARATDMLHTGEVNLGQLARERYGRQAVFAVGFGTGTGTVSAARRWDGQREVMQTPEPRPDSIEAALLASGGGDRLLLLDPGSPAVAALDRALPHRAIGVVFDPRWEPKRNYVPTRLAQRYDAFVFLPQTHALEPLAE